MTLGQKLKIIEAERVKTTSVAREHLICTIKAKIKQMIDKGDIPEIVCEGSQKSWVYLGIKGKLAAELERDEHIWLAFTDWLASEGLDFRAEVDRDQKDRLETITMRFYSKE